MFGKKKKEVVEVTDEVKWLSETSRTLVLETLKIIHKCPKPNGKNSLNIPLVYGFLQRYVETLVSHVLNDYKDKMFTDQEAIKHTSMGVRNVKDNVQAAVSGGFEKAFADSYNQAVPYYCVINPEPEPRNKLPC